MAKIEEIDYDEIINKASQIANSADSMQKSVKEAFVEIQSMSQDWYGHSYDNFINTVNMSITALNDIFEVTVSDIPHEIAAKAKSYAASNQASTNTSLNEQVAIILNEIPKTNKGSKLRFRSNEVLAHGKTIKAKFEQANSHAEKAKSISMSLANDWKSISGDNNIQELKKAFDRLKRILTLLHKAMVDQITAQETVINSLETAANTVEAAQNVVEGAVDSVVDFATNKVSDIRDSAANIWRNLTGKN